MSDAVQVEGIKDVLNAFGRIDKGLRKELRVELVAAAGLVAAKAKDIAEQLGLRDTGKLIASIRPGMSGAYAYVTDSAKRNGFNYPAVYEFGHNRERAFLNPAADAEREHVIVGIEGLLDRLTSEAGLAKGGVL